MLTLTLACILGYILSIVPIHALDSQWDLHQFHLWFALSYVLAIAALRYFLYAGFSRQYCGHIRGLLLDSGLLYMLFEHEPAEHVVAFVKQGTIRLPGKTAMGLRFADRLRYIISAYSRAARALSRDPYPPGLILLDKLLTLGFVVMGLLYVCLVPVLSYTWANMPEAVIYEVLGALGLVLVTVLFFLHEARDDSVVRVLLDILDAGGQAAEPPRTIAAC